LRSTPTLPNPGFDFRSGEFWFPLVPVKDLLAQLENSGDRRAHGFQIAAAFGHQARDRLFVPGDDDFFALGNPFKELTKPGLGF
jgi:hypothetical protein